MLTSDAIKAFLVCKLGIDESLVTETAPLFSSGLIDSFSMLDLITFIEEEGALEMRPEDVSLDNLDSVKQIIAFVAKDRSI